MANVSYWDEYDIIHNNRGQPMDIINSKLDNLYNKVDYGQLFIGSSLIPLKWK